MAAEGCGTTWVTLRTVDGTARSAGVELTVWAIAADVPATVRVARWAGGAAGRSGAAESEAPAAAETAAALCSLEVAEDTGPMGLPDARGGAGTMSMPGATLPLRTVPQLRVRYFQSPCFSV